MGEVVRAKACTFQLPYRRADVWTVLVSLAGCADVGVVVNQTDHSACFDMGHDPGGLFRSRAHWHTSRLLRVGMFRRVRLRGGGVVTYRLRSLTPGVRMVWDVVSQLGTKVVLVGTGEVAPTTSTVLTDWVDQATGQVLGATVTISFEFDRLVEPYSAAGTAPTLVSTIMSWFGIERHETADPSQEARLEASLLDNDEVMKSWWRDMAHHAEPIAVGEAWLVRQGHAKPLRARVIPSAKVIQRQWRAHHGSTFQSPPPEGGGSAVLAHEKGARRPPKGNGRRALCSTSTSFNSRSNGSQHPKVKRPFLGDSLIKSFSPSFLRAS